MLSSLLVAMLLTSCGGGGGSRGPITENRTVRGYNPGVGPFDSQGNYVERWADDKSKGQWWRQSIVHDPVATTGTPSTASKPPVVAAVPKPSAPSSSSAPKPSTPSIASAPKPAPAVKVKPAAKPPIRHTVQKGDTLWGLSRKYKTTVQAIQRANGMKGTNLRIGRTLVIPRY
jgi:LysM repeat protein